MKGRKCSLIFMRKVASRLAVLEERYKDLPHQERAEKINKEMMETFCVGEREIRRWKSIVNIARKVDNIVRLPPTHYTEIAKLPEESQQKIIEQVANNNLTYQQTALLVQETLGKSDFKPQIYNVWNFQECDDKFGVRGYPGRTPGQIVENVLYYFTQQGDLVVDPMAGSGTTLDVCRSMNRQCLAYDLKPCRPEIIKHNISVGFPPETDKCNLIYLDPPYYNMVFKDLYENIDDFYDFIQALAQNCYHTLANDGYVSLLMGDMTEIENHCLSGDCYCIFVSHGFECVAHISCPYSTEQFTGYDVERARNTQTMLGRNRDLYVFRKKGAETNGKA